MFIELLDEYKQMIDQKAGNKLRHFIIKEFAESLKKIIKMCPEMNEVKIDDQPDDFE